jgi:hypothetical protein
MGLSMFAVKRSKIMAERSDIVERVACLFLQTPTIAKIEEIVSQKMIQ